MHKEVDEYLKSRSPMLELAGGSIQMLGVSQTLYDWSCQYLTKQKLNRDCMFLFPMQLRKHIAFGPDLGLGNDGSSYELNLAVYDRSTPFDDGMYRYSYLNRNNRRNWYLTPNEQSVRVAVSMVAFKTNRLNQCLTR